MSTPGILIINKPLKITSHDVIDKVREITGEWRVGHAGTLDPLASGVLIVLVGREATKRQAEFMASEKEYIATIRLGATSNTDDAEGTVSETTTPKGKNPDEIQIQKTLKKFVGEIKQVPPAYSAIKIKGKRAYALAREGKTPLLKSRVVTISAIELLDYNYPVLKIRVTCSKGTYIRSLARDIGKELSLGAYLNGLIRTRSGKYSINDAVSLATLTSENITGSLVKIEEMP